MRTRFAPEGVFGTLYGESANRITDTLEHSYEDLKPKLPAGAYLCKRGFHQLSKGPKFETFEITGVEGHTGILFHAGNTENNSSGCILLGSAANAGVWRSREAFAYLMTLQHGIETFTLTVIDN